PPSLDDVSSLPALPPAPAICPLSLHDALPICLLAARDFVARAIASTVLLDVVPVTVRVQPSGARRYRCAKFNDSAAFPQPSDPRSEEHTSELQSHLNLVCRLLLEKKNMRDHRW